LRRRSATLYANAVQQGKAGDDQRAGAASGDLLVVTVCLGGGAVGETLGAAFIGPPEIVFDTKTQSCEPTDNPDQSAVRSVTSQSGAPDRDPLDVRRWWVRISINSPAAAMSCSALRAIRTLRIRPVQMARRILHGRRAEYRGARAHRVPRFRCAGIVRGTQGQGVRVLVDAITYACFDDGGNSFTVPRPPGNLIASLHIGIRRAPSMAPWIPGPTAIVQLGAFHYAFFSTRTFATRSSGLA